MRMAAPVIAAVKRGAGPNSPRLTAEVSSMSTQPAPISMSACRLEVGSATRWRFFTPRRISARVASIGTPATSRGTASMMPSVIGASASSMVSAMIGIGCSLGLPAPGDAGSTFIWSMRVGECGQICRRRQPRREHPDTATAGD